MAGADLVMMAFANVPSSYTDGTMTAAEIVSSFIQESYIDANTDTSGGSANPSEEVRFGEDEYPMGEWSPGDDTDANDSVSMDGDSWTGRVPNE